MNEYGISLHLQVDLSVPFQIVISFFVEHITNTFFYFSDCLHFLFAIQRDKQQIESFFSFTRQNIYKVTLIVDNCTKTPKPTHRKCFSFFFSSGRKREKKTIFSSIRFVLCILIKWQINNKWK